MPRAPRLRLPPQLSHNITLAIAAEKSGCTRAEILGLWLALLDHANQHDGALGTLDQESLSLWLQLPPEKCRRALTALTEKKWLGRDQRITGWPAYLSSATHRARRRRAQPAPSAVPRTPRATPTPVARMARPDPDSPAEIAARRERLMHNSGLIIGTTPAKKVQHD